MNREQFIEKFKVATSDKEKLKIVIAYIDSTAHEYLAQEGYAGEQSFNCLSSFAHHLEASLIEFE